MKDTWWVDPDQLDDDQREVLELPLGRSYLVLGPPGSGKTNLLTLRANYSVLAGRSNVGVVVFTRVLRQFIAAGTVHYAFEPGLVTTSQRWMTEFLRRHGENVSDIRELSFEDARSALIDRMRETVARRHLQRSVQTLLIDEAQDLLEDELAVLSEVAEDLFVVADDRQQIYRKGDPLSVLRDRALLRTLRHNYRNGLAICAAADRIAIRDSSYVSLENTSNYDEHANPSTVDIAPCADLVAQAVAIIDRLKTQLKAYPGMLLGVLAAQRRDLKAFWSVLQASELGSYATWLKSDEEVIFDAARPICVSTIHSAKGLEFRCVHLLAAERLGTVPHGVNLAYTAVTRAQTSLSVYHSAYLPPFLRVALQSSIPSGDVPSLDRVFGKAGVVK